MSQGNDNPIKIIDDQGQERRLGLLPMNDEVLVKRKAHASFTEYLATKGMNLIPESDWQDIDYGDFFGPQFINDQKNSSGCVGWSAAGAEMATRAAMGMPFEKLSGAFIYAQINGGRDAGSYINDAMTAGAKYGYCLESEFNYPKLFKNQIPQSAYESAAGRQATNAYTISSEEEFFTAIRLGFFPQFGVYASGSFTRFDSDGVSAVRGGWANHSVYARGMKKIRGNWCGRLVNSWNLGFGPFGDGTCYVDRRGVILGDAFVHIAGEWNPALIPTPVS
jgi:hypothetical protein